MSEPLPPVLHENDDFILIVENAVPPEVCERYIEFFKIMNMRGRSYTRESSTPGTTRMQIDDRALDIVQRSIVEDLEFRNLGQEFDGFFWANCYAPYAAKYPILKEYAPHKIFRIKIQRTLPGQGYHTWHAEDMGQDVSDRLMTFIIYLNDVEEGGETEFLYQHKRVKPKTGTCVLWPATYTHPHRGNPPLKGEKYILTGWVEL
jgi:hypothetical protein